MAANVRRLGPDDFEGALLLYRDLVGNTPVLEGPAGQRRFEQILKLEGTAIYGAEIAEGIVSMATLHVLPNMAFGGRSYGLVENVVTLKSHQKLELARAVMHALLKDAWAQDAYKVMLLSGKYFDTLGFHQKLGFNSDDKHGLIIRRAPPRQPKV